MAANQVAGAGAGAIGMDGNLELMSRSFGLNSIDFDEPQFFSETMDHKTTCVNIHSIQNRADIQHNSFHLKELSAHLLSDPEGLRAL